MSSNRRRSNPSAPNASSSAAATAAAAAAAADGPVAAASAVENNHGDANVMWTRDRLHQLEKLVLNPHFAPVDRMDRVAMNMVRIVDGMVELMGMNQLYHQALIMETLGVVPGLVVYPVQRIRSMFLSKPSEYLVPAMDEAMREPWHLATWIGVLGTNFIKRAFFLAFALMYTLMWLAMYIPFYLLFPQFAHRFNGYLEEMAVGRYTRILAAIDSGALENVPAPISAIAHWKLAKDATIRDVVLLIRAEEADFREVHHFIGSHFADMKDRVDLDMSQCFAPGNLQLPDKAAARVSRPGHSLPSMTMPEKGSEVSTAPAASR